MDPLDGIAAFARVVDCGSFSAAARRLNISKSAVSAHVQRLEERLGVRLLNRSTRRLSLTDAGAAYYRHCARILAEAEAAEQAAGALQREPRGTLRISAPESFGWRHVAPAVPAFLRRYPDLAVDIALSPAHVNLVDEGLDLAIRIGVLEDSPLVVRKLAPSRLVLCAAPSYLAERGVPREPRELAGHDCLCASVLPWGGEWRLVGAGGEVRVAVSGSFRTNSAEMLRTAALDGVGIAVLPTWSVAEPLRTGALQRVLAAWEPPGSTIYAAYPGNRLMSMKVRAFVDHLARRFGPTPYWDAEQSQAGHDCENLSAGVNAMAGKTSRKPGKAAAERAAAKPTLLAGGNPQIAKADGDAPVQAYIAAMPGWKSDVGRRLDALIVRTVPGVRKAVKWNSPFYGVEGQGWFLSYHCFTKYVKVTFFRGASLRPVPPGLSKHKEVRYLDIYEGQLDEAQFADWVKQASLLPGERM